MADSSCGVTTWKNELIASNLLLDIRSNNRTTVESQLSKLIGDWPVCKIKLYV